MPRQLKKLRHRIAGVPEWLDKQLGARIRGETRRSSALPRHSVPDSGQAISVVGLSQAAAVLLVVGLTLWFFCPPKQQVASSEPAALNHNQAGSRGSRHYPALISKKVTWL